MEILAPLAIGVLLVSWAAHRVLRRRAPKPWCDLLSGLGQRYPHLTQLVDVGRRKAPRQVDIPHGEALVRLSLKAFGGVEVEVLTITLTARWPVPAGPELRVIAEGLLESVLKEWGAMQDVVVGQRDFDAQYVVHARDEAAMRAAWSPRARQIMVARAPRFVRSDGREISMEAEGDSPEAVGDLIELMAALATADLFGVSALRALPGAAYREPTGPYEARTPPRVEIEAAGTRERVRIEPAAVTEIVARPVTRASITASVEKAAWSVGVRASGELEGATEGLPLPEGIHHHLWGVGAGTLAQEGRTVSFTWSAVETDPGRLGAAVELLALFARPLPGGAYR